MYLLDNFFEDESMRISNIEEDNTSDLGQNELDLEVLQILGVEPSNSTKNELELHPMLAKKWNNYISKGVEPNLKKELIEKYPLEGNCKLAAPKLNPELVSMLNEGALKRDKHFGDSQNLLGAGMSALGMALSSLLTNKEGGIG